MREAREAAGLSQPDADTLLGFKPGVVAKREQGTRGVSADELERMLALYAEEADKRQNGRGHNVPRGTSATVQRLRDQIERVGPSGGKAIDPSGPVYGPSGELLREDGPEGPLIEALLFGLVRSIPEMTVEDQRMVRAGAKGFLNGIFSHGGTDANPTPEEMNRQLRIFFAGAAPLIVQGEIEKRAEEAKQAKRGKGGK